MRQGSLLAMADVMGVAQGGLSEQSAATHRKLTQAANDLPGVDREAVLILLGIHDGEGLSLTSRRRLAADRLVLTPESFRRHREPRLWERLAQTLVLRRAHQGKAALAERAGDGKQVLVIHGRDVGAAQGVFAFLRALGLRPADWQEMIAETGVGFPAVDRALQAAIEQVQVVVVLLTPDDAGQPRSNVVFEAGLAYGLAPTRTLLVEVGDVKSPSDVIGLSVLRLGNSPASRSAFRARLIEAGGAVDGSRDEWLTAGHFADTPSPSATPPLGLFSSDDLEAALLAIGWMQEAVDDDHNVWTNPADGQYVLIYRGWRDIRVNDPIMRTLLRDLDAVSGQFVDALVAARARSSIVPDEGSRSAAVQRRS